MKTNNYTNFLEDLMYNLISSVLITMRFYVLPIHNND